jgi:hypothetical protein
MQCALSFCHFKLVLNAALFTVAFCICVSGVCCGQGLALKPRKGDATIFWSIRPDGTFDHKSLHGSCPVIKGTKISATKWCVAVLSPAQSAREDLHPACPAAALL